MSTETIEKPRSFVPYQGAYRASLDKDEEPEQQVEEQKPETTEEPEPKTPEEKTWKQRYGNLKSYVDTTLKPRIKELEEQVKTATAEPPKGSVEVPEGSSDDEVKAWLEKYPDVARVVSRLAEQIANDKVSKYEEKLNKIEQESAETRAEKAYRELVELHPDFPKLAKTEAFHSWLREQDEADQDVFLNDNDMNVKKASKLLKLFKAETGIPLDPKKAEKAAVKEAARDVNSRSRAEEPKVDGDGTVYSESLVQKMSSKRGWYEANEEAILKAVRTGKFVYDMSGAAR